MAWPVYHLGNTPSPIYDKPVFFNRNPPTSVNLLLIATGGEGIVGGGGGGGLVIQNNFSTGFIPWYGPPNPKNKFTFTVGGRANGSGNTAITGLHTVWKTYSESGAVTSTTTVFQGGYGGASNLYAGSGGSGGGGNFASGGWVEGASGTPGQGNSGGRGFGALSSYVCVCNGFTRCFMYYSLGGGGGGYSSAGGNFYTPGGSCPGATPGAGGAGLNISSYLSPYLQTTLSGGNSVLSSAGYSGYSTLWASSGGGASGSRGSCSCSGNTIGQQNYSSSGGPGAGSGTSPNASGFGCGSGGGAVYGVNGSSGGGLVVVSYEGRPASSDGIIVDYDSSSNRTYHVVIGPPQANYQYADFPIQF